MEWRKLGRLIEPASAPWMVTHAAVPFVHRLSDDDIRIYFTSRDAEGRSHTGFAELDVRDPFGSMRISDAPVLSPGEMGAFDDRGAMGSWVVEKDGLLHMYYIGWNLGVTVPFYSWTGLAVSSDGGLTFERETRGYAFPRDDVDPFIATNPSLIVEDDLWRIWYISGVRWVVEDGEPKHYYHIKYDESPDGRNWERLGTVAIDFACEEEYALARPAVFRRPEGYEMLYAYRAQPSTATYRIGFATSDDGRVWTRRDDEAGIDVSDDGFDSEMVCYGTTFDHGSDRYLLYNGNGYGQTGIGLAVLDR